MPREVRVYLQDMLEAIEHIEAYTNGFDGKTLEGDQLRQDAVIRNLEVLGEAAKRVPEDVGRQAPDIEWRKLAGLRDILIHQYFGVDIGILKDVVEHKLPLLKNPIRGLLESLS